MSQSNFVVQENIPLAPFTSYLIGGPARYFMRPLNIDEMDQAVRWAQAHHQEIFILGGGTNLLVSDEGFSGAVIKPDFQFIEVEDCSIRVGAGVAMAQVLETAATHGLSGLEWAGGLPGTVGGAVRGNAGAFGGEIKDVVSAVESFDLVTSELRRRLPLECRFGYRSSIFKELAGREIITTINFNLTKNEPVKIKAAIQGKIDYRLLRHPMDYPNIGSIFKNVPLAQIDANVTWISAQTIRINPLSNPHKSAFTAPVKVDPFPVVPAAHLIAEAGLVAVSRGGAMISPRHPNFIVNTLGASAADVQSLIHLVRARVQEQFQIGLEEEIQVVPPLENKNFNNFQS